MRFTVIATLVLIIFCTLFPALSNSGGLMFHLSGNSPGDGFTADHANGDPEPAYLKSISRIDDGAHGTAFHAPSAVDKIIAYPAPGNINAQRGTLSFFFRSGFPVGETAFKLFYVSYCLHSSLDGTWLRVDYNGEGGYDAFVTDVNMARIRIRYTPPDFPEPNEWTHLALSWDETQGIRFYCNGKRVAAKDTTTVFDAGLAFLKPFGRFATSGTVTDSCGHIRGGDFDEIVIYDSMLNDEEISLLSKGILPEDQSYPVRRLDDERYRHEWWHRNGWDNPGITPIALDNSKTWSVRKVEILDARDQKKWTWRANDGMRESVWPDVYNRSRLLGRTDYFIEPDWYCYSTSGKNISFNMPDEPWNYIQISGAAYGKAELERLDTETRKYKRKTLFNRPKGTERTFHDINANTGGTIHFTNNVQETPIGEFSVYNVTTDRVPTGIWTLSYTITNYDLPENNSLNELKQYISGRFPIDEQTLMVALPHRAPRYKKAEKPSASPLPLVHVIIPYQFADEGPRTGATGYGGFTYTWKGMYAGLDGIAIDLPAMNLEATHDGYIPMNIAIKDPLWPNRAMADFSFRVKPGEAKTLWFDTRDRILPERHSIYLTFSAAGQDFGPEVLEGTGVRLVFKDYNASKKEHVLDRFTQVRDLFAADYSETFPKRLKLDHRKRFERDMLDLFRVEPDHNPGRFYWNRINSDQYTLPFEQPKAPSGIPLWAFRQVEILKQWHRYLDWWIDNRQIENGEFGGGLSDDGDFANCIPPLALMGVMPEKITDSMVRLMDSYYSNGMFTNGLNTIVTDALHVAEEGLNVQSEQMLLTYGDPKTVERMMETSARYPELFKINEAGHRHVISSFYGSSKFATEEPWCWSSRHTHTVLYPGINLVDFNGNSQVLKLICEYADGFMAHGKPEKNGQIALPAAINFLTDEAREYSVGRARQLFMALENFTGNEKYRPYTLVPPHNGHPFVDKNNLSHAYAKLIQFNDERMYIATEGFPWDDGPYLSYGSIVTDRLGGWPIRRSSQYGEDAISWAFDSPHDGESIAVLTPSPTRTSVKIIVFNLEEDTVNATILGRQIDPGIWEKRQGIDTDGDDTADTEITVSEISFGRTEGIRTALPAGKTSIIELTLKKPGIPYWQRQDLGIGIYDITVKGRNVNVTIHNLGSIESIETPIALVTENGDFVANTNIPPINSPNDLKPKTTHIRLKAPRGQDMKKLSVVIDPQNTITENTRMNNSIELKCVINKK